MTRVPWARLRWRLRGAAQWPVFAALTLAEAVLLNVLPVWGDGPGGPVAGLLIAGFINLAVVAIAAPLIGRLLRRLRRDLPRAIATDYAATVLLLAVAAAIVAGGLGNHSEVEHDRKAEARGLAAVAHYVALEAPGRRAALPLRDTLRLERDLYRTCLPGPDPDRWYCLFVDTRTDPPRITRDGDTVPNSLYSR
jgi:hypothetical protein